MVGKNEVGLLHEDMSRIMDYLGLMIVDMESKKSQRLMMQKEISSSTTYPLKAMIVPHQEETYLAVVEPEGIALYRLDRAHSSLQLVAKAVNPKQASVRYFSHHGDTISAITGDDCLYCLYSVPSLKLLSRVAIADSKPTCFIRSPSSYLLSTANFTLYSITG